jgi:hypothetical protein
MQKGFGLGRPMRLKARTKLSARKVGLSPYELGRKFFERNPRTRPTHDTAKNSKQLLIEHFRGKRRKS